MKISKIIVNNFRSVKNCCLDVDDLNILVGQNNHGKTNFFEAIDWFFNGTKKSETIDEIRFGRTGNAEVFVEVEFYGAQDGVNHMKNEANKTKMAKLLNKNDLVTIKRSSNDSKKRAISINGTWQNKVPTGFDNALNDFLPHFEYVDTRKYFEDVAKYSKGTPIGIMLSGVLTTILESSKDYQAFRKQFEKVFGDSKSDIKVELDKLSNKVKIYLEKQFPDCTKVTFEVSPPIFDDLLKSFDTTIDDGVETRTSEKGDGMQRALMLAILQAYTEFRKSSVELGKSFLFFIDEAELHLHPSAQRKLKNVLVDLSVNEDQVFINTHSSVLVVDEHSHQKIFEVEKINKETFISPILKLQKPHVIYELLGGSPADLLLPKNFLIVEGKTELELLTRIINRFYDKKPQIQIVIADGDIKQVNRSFNAIEQIFKPLGESIYKEILVIYVDKQKNPNQVTSFLTSYPFLRTNSQFFESDTNTIEELYPPLWKKSQKMPGDEKVNLAKEVGDNISQLDFEKNMPIILKALEQCWIKAFK